MKTTLEIPGDLYRRTKAAAALRGQTLKDFVTEALEAHLRRPEAGASAQRGWRSVFGKARREDVEAVDTVTFAEFDRIDPDEWR